MSPLGGWGGLTIAFTGKFVYIYRERDIFIYIFGTEVRYLEILFFKVLMNRFGIVTALLYVE